MTRTQILSSIVVVAVVAVAGRAIVAQQPAAGPKVLTIEKVKDNLYMLPGGGAGNTAVFVTANGVVLVDTKLADWGQAILDQVKTVTDKPVTHIINTHTHGDHTGSNDFFPASVEVVAHANVTASMQKMPQFADPSKKHAFPDKTYTDKLTVLGGSEAIDLYHFGPAHTNGDTFVVFRALKVMHSGDVFAAKGTPFIDRNNGGNGVTYPETVAKAAAGIKDVDTVIPGHSAVTTFAAFVEYGEFMKAIVAAATRPRRPARPPSRARPSSSCRRSSRTTRSPAPRTTSRRSTRICRRATRRPSPALLEESPEVGTVADRRERRIRRDVARPIAGRDRAQPADRGVGVALLQAGAGGRQPEIARPQPPALQLIEHRTRRGELRGAEERLAVGQPQPRIVGPRLDQIGVDGRRGGELAGRDVRGRGSFRRPRRIDAW